MGYWKSLLALALAFPMWTQALPAQSQPLPPANLPGVEAHVTPPVRVAEAKTLVLEEAGIQLQVPQGWTSFKDKDGYNLHTADKSMAIIVRVCTEDDCKTYVEALKSIQNQKFKDVQVKDTRKETLNGLPTSSVGGTATMDGEPIFWSIDVVQGSQPAVFYSVMSKKATEVHGDAYRALVESIRKEDG